MVTDDLYFLFLWQVILSFSYLLLGITESNYFRCHVSWCATAVLDWHVLYFALVIITFLRLLKVTNTKVTNL